MPTRPIARLESSTSQGAVILVDEQIQLSLMFNYYKVPHHLISWIWVKSNAERTKSHYAHLILPLHPHEYHAYTHNTVPLAICGLHARVLVKIVECLQLPLLALPHLFVSNVGAITSVHIVEVNKGRGFGVGRLCAVPVSTRFFGWIHGHRRARVASTIDLVILGFSAVVRVISAGLLTVHAESCVGAAIMDMACKWSVWSSRNEISGEFYQLYPLVPHQSPLSIYTRA
jgi:hypothetical protein